jgi:hypothetical protein
MVYYALGKSSESDAALQQLVGKYERSVPYTIATVYAYRRENDRAFAWLEKAVAYHDQAVSSASVDPTLGNLHDDPRWLPFLRKHGMAPEQLAAIKFDVKVPQ